MGIELVKSKPYYILLGRKAHGEFLPLFIDVINNHKLGSIIQSRSIGTLFKDREKAKRAGNLLADKYSFNAIQMATLQIIEDVK